MSSDHGNSGKTQENQSPYLDPTGKADDGGEEGLLVLHVVAAEKDVLSVPAVKGQLGLLQGVILVLLVRGGRVQLEGGDRRLGRLAVRVRTTYAENLQERVTAIDHKGPWSIQGA